jgi:hypothetical protein
VERIRSSYDAAQLYRFERVSARYALLLFAKLEALFLGVPGREINTVFELRLLSAHILGEGRAVYDAVMREPSLALVHAERMTCASGFYFQGLFRYEQCQFQSQKLRMMEHCEPQPKQAPESDEQRYGRMGAELGRQFGLLRMFTFLRAQFLEPEDVLDTPERWPSYTIRSSGEMYWLSMPYDEVVGSHTSSQWRLQR